MEFKQRGIQLLLVYLRQFSSSALFRGLSWFQLPTQPLWYHWMVGGSVLADYLEKPSGAYFVYGTAATTTTDNEWLMGSLDKVVSQTRSRERESSARKPPPN